ncbi:MAG: CoB--CoM heterodisulfide reductase iron-sulfur subunit A family protein [Bacteroidales bacterium]|nr:CoB--CoM heterodisulfide reductase iron-sulfur subunit A family protein [Bacteroidales bacterium]HOY38023.1 FAD-dependent oxidoreductase [Bacteroidales bacterium]HQP04026.1 FAD-dependent oxidoreductase [Bacteroidales bacterium]
MKKKLGIYICACGGNISDYVDIEKVKEAIKDEDAVILAKTTMFACGDTNQKDMDADIKANDLSGVVVASCSPKLHLTTFRNVSERAGLNPYTYVHANIREQASWAHSDDKTGATEKAIQIVKAAIAKARLAEALNPITIKSERSVAVVGAGVAGMKAALSLAGMNDKVYLIEKSKEIGGKLKTMDVISPEKQSGSDLLKQLEAEIANNSRIELFTETMLAESSGSIGNFTLKLNSPAGNREVTVGSVLLATGFDTYTPEEGEFGYHSHSNVITLPEFKAILQNSSGKQLVVNDKEINSVAFIYCVGSRQVKGDNKHCSRFCCTAAMQTSLDATAKFSNLQCYHFTRGVRSYGKQELIYKATNDKGDIYVQFLDKKPPVVEASGDKLSVKAVDLLLEKREHEAEVDLVVLVTGMVPDKDETIGNIFKLPKGRDHFFNEIHMKLRPVETVIDGVTIAGACQGPKNVAESVNSAIAAATKAHSIIAKGELQLEPIVAYVDKETCNWCNACTNACPFSAISTIDFNGKKVAEISKSNCKGCGMCLPVCPSDSIELISFTNKEMESMIDVLAQ